MSEYVGKLYIYNGKLESSQDFNEKQDEKLKTIYEVIRVVDGIPLFLEKHISRLENSSKLSGIDLWIDKNDIKQSIMSLVKANSCLNGNVKVICSVDVNDKKNYAVYFIKHHYPSSEDYKNGVSTIFYHGERLNPNAKVINTDFRKAVDTEIGKFGVYEAILVDRNGIITEGSKSNVFLIKGEKVVTAPLKLVLPGVTRDLIIKACKENKIDVLEEEINYSDIASFDALFISGTSPKVLPVKSIGDIAFKSSENSILKNISSAYDNIIENYMKNYVVNL